MRSCGAGAVIFTTCQNPAPDELIRLSNARSLNLVEVPEQALEDR
jgi:hypothetical protein